MTQMLPQFIPAVTPLRKLEQGEHPNALTIRRGYEAVEHGDMQVLDAMFADDVTWHGLTGSRNPLLSSDYQGKQAVFGLFGEMGARTGGTLRREIRDVIANDRWAAVWVRDSGARDNEERVWDELQVFTFTPDGQVKEFRALPFDMTVVDAFWS